MVTAKIKRRFYQAIPFLLPLAAFFLVMLQSEASLKGAREGLNLCARVIVPSLFPFFVLSGLLSGLGFPYYLGKLSDPVMRTFFGVGGCGASVFILGITGGYPLGAAAISDMYKKGECGKDEAERLLAFCNNSGPAFIIGAAGIGVFGSLSAGLIIYLSHIAAAALAGALLSRGHEYSSAPMDFQALGFTKAFSESVKQAAMSTISICGFVAFFSVINSVLSSIGVFSAGALVISEFSGLDLSLSRALLVGLLEIGNGIGTLGGVPLDPVSAAAASFILGWGGLSVHCQAFALAGSAGLSMGRHSIGKLLHGALSALITCLILISIKN